MINPLSTRPRPDATACPACQRYVGTVAACPYCGLDMVHPVSIRSLRLAASLLAVFGILCLYLMARAHELPPIRIEQITSRMNRATVRVTGHVGTVPFVSRHNGATRYVSFLVDDGTGTLDVCASTSVAASLAAAGHIPKWGDRVDLMGRLSIHANGKRLLRLQTVDGLSTLSSHAGKE